MVQCPNCGTSNRTGAKFCSSCGQLLAPTSSTPLQPEKESKPSCLGVFSFFRRLLPHRGKNAISKQSSEMSVPPYSATQVTVPLASRGNLPPLSPRDNIGNLSVVVRTYPLTNSNYYDVSDLQCAECGQGERFNPGGICTHCQTPLPRYLVRESGETRPEARGNLDEAELLRLSHNSPFIVPHYRVRWLNDRTYIWLPPLAQWRSMAKVKPPIPVGQIISWGQHIAGALIALAGHAYYDPHLSGIEKMIIDGGTARLADLTSCRRVEPDQLDFGVQRDSFFLARVLYHLLTGQNLTKDSHNIANLPQPLRCVIERALRQEYRALDEMLADLDRCRSRDDYGLSLKPLSGKASDPGRVRDNNEDSLIVLELTRVQESRGVPLGLYVVADGMGGHQAGELASRTVNKIITERVLNAEVIPGLQFATRRLDETPESVLRAAIQEANRILHTQAQTRGSNMGTTLTAALLIGDTATIASVGDSRTYLLRQKELYQITTDHSLVASLVAAGVIQPEEAREHPQRNQIYRSLGDKAEIEVDIFTQSLQREDQLILCSDGLWEMVSDANIKRLAQTAASPQEACDALVRAANAAGGEDNVTVIVVRLE